MQLGHATSFQTLVATHLVSFWLYFSMHSMTLYLNIALYTIIIYVYTYMQARTSASITVREINLNSPVFETFLKVLFLIFLIRSYSSTVEAL
jgi:hypothetical protein